MVVQISVKATNINLMVVLEENSRVSQRFVGFFFWEPRMSTKFHSSKKRSCRDNSVWTNWLKLWSWRLMFGPDQKVSVHSADQINILPVWNTFCTIKTQLSVFRHELTLTSLNKWTVSNSICFWVRADCYPVFLNCGCEDTLVFILQSGLRFSLPDCKPNFLWSNYKVELGLQVSVCVLISDMKV